LIGIIGDWCLRILSRLLELLRHTPVISHLATPQI